MERVQATLVVAYVAALPKANGIGGTKDKVEQESMAELVLGETTAWLAGGIA